MSKRTDWRFLLPDGGTKKSYAFVVGGYDATIEAVLATKAYQVSFGDIPSAPVDLLMVRHTVPLSEIRTLYDYLNEGAFLYLEVQRARWHEWSRMPRHITATLNIAGLTAIYAYGVTPNFGTPRCYLPLSYPHVLRWYLETLFIAGTFPTRLAKIVLLRVPWLMAWLLPCFVVVGVKGKNMGMSLPPLLQHSAFPASVTKRATTFALLTSGFDPGSRTVVLPFNDKTLGPLATLKIAGDAALNAYTEQEQKILASLHSILPTSMARSIPTPLGAFIDDERVVSVESSAMGKPLWVTLYEPAPLKRYIDLLMQATRWMANFHQATRRDAPLDKSTFRDEWLLLLLERYHRLFPQNSESNLFNLTLEYLNQLPDSPLPIVWQHFDYSPWNIYHDDNHLTVIDWELGRTTPNAPYGPAGCDLLYFLKYWLHAVLRTTGDDTEYRAFHFLPSHLPLPLYNACRQAIQTYCEIVGMDTDWIPVLTVYGWVEQAVHQAERQLQLSWRSSSPSTPKAVDYLSALNRHADSLFTR